MMSSVRLIVNLVLINRKLLIVEDAVTYFLSFFIYCIENEPKKSNWGFNISKNLALKASWMVSPFLLRL